MSGIMRNGKFKMLTYFSSLHIFDTMLPRLLQAALNRPEGVRMRMYKCSYHRVRRNRLGFLVNVTHHNYSTVNRASSLTVSPALFVATQANTAPSSSGLAISR